MVSISGGSAELIREQYEKVWKKASPLDDGKAGGAKKPAARKRAAGKKPST
jgi:hypothetical protein